MSISVKSMMITDLGPGWEDGGELWSSLLLREAEELCPRILGV